MIISPATESNGSEAITLLDIVGDLKDRLMALEGKTNKFNRFNQQHKRETTEQWKPCTPEEVIFYERFPECE